MPERSGAGIDRLREADGSLSRPAIRKILPPAATEFCNFTELVARTGLPRNWLRAQAREGLLPSLKVGPRWYFRVEAVRQVLDELSGAAQ